MYDFDTLYPRTGLASEKWDMMARAGCTQAGIVPLSVADMEFRAAPEIVHAVQAAAEFGLWGYTHGDAALREAVCGWFSRRHGWQASPDWIVNTSGVIPAMHTAVDAFTQPGDRVLVQPPVYHHFFSAVEPSGRTLLENPLVKGADGRYSIDFEDLRRKAPLAKMMLLCSPHNPAGRVWTREELAQIADICYENKVLLFVDEIHCDILMPGHSFVPFGTLEEKHLANCLIGTAASKSFSLAGLSTSSIFIPDEGLRRRFRQAMEAEGHYFNSTFGYVATKAAYEKAEPWLDAMLAYVNENYKMLTKHLIKHPKIQLTPMEGTYLAWLDFSAYGMGDDELNRFLQTEACLFLNPGKIFGEGGSGHMRINLACPRQVLAAALQRMENALENRE